MSHPVVGANTTGADGSPPASADGYRQRSAHGSQIRGVNLRGTGISLTGRTALFDAASGLCEGYPTRRMRTPTVGDIACTLSRVVCPLFGASSHHTRAHAMEPKLSGPRLSRNPRMGAQMFLNDCRRNFNTGLRANTRRQAAALRSRNSA